MITGFNTDVDHDGKVFHVQTEDKGTDNPVVESLIYCKGEIVGSQRSAYGDLADDGSFDPDAVLQRMEFQHQGLIRDIRNGRFDEGGPKPFGHNIITNRSLDDVVLEFIRSSDDLGPLKLELVDEVVLLHGTRPTLRMRLLEERSGRAVHRAQVVVRLISTEDQPREMFAGQTDEEGFFEASFELPDMPRADMAVVCKATAARESTEFRQLVHRAASPAAKVAKV